MERVNEQLVLTPYEAASIFPSVVAFGVAITPIPTEFSNSEAIGSIISAFRDKDFPVNTIGIHAMSLLHDAAELMIGIEENVVFDEPQATIIEEGLVWCNNNPKMCESFAIIAITSGLLELNDNPVASLIIQRDLIANLDHLLTNAYVLAEKVTQTKQ